MELRGVLELSSVFNGFDHTLTTGSLTQNRGQNITGGIWHKHTEGWSDVPTALQHNFSNKNIKIYSNIWSRNLKTWMQISVHFPVGDN